MTLKMPSGLFSAPNLSPAAVIGEWAELDHALDGTANEGTRHIQLLRDRMQGTASTAATNVNEAPKFETVYLPPVRAGPALSGDEAEYEF